MISDMVAIVIALIIAGIGAAAFFFIVRKLSDVGKPREEEVVDCDAIIEPVEPDGEIHSDGLVYMYAGRFVKPASRRAIGSIPRDRAFDINDETELEPRDFAQQVLYVTLVDLYEQGRIKFACVPRDPGFMPPFPHKAWELKLQRIGEVSAGPVADGINMAFEAIHEKRQKRARKAAERAGMPEPADFDRWVSFDELVEHTLKAIRKEMTFWERGCIYSDLRNCVGMSLIRQGFILGPQDETVLDKFRKRIPAPNPIAVEQHDLEKAAEDLAKRIEAFRARLGSPAAAEDPNWPTGDVDPGLLAPKGQLEDLPLDDCLRLSIYETLIAIRQLEPSGEAGI